MAWDRFTGHPVAFEADRNHGTLDLMEILREPEFQELVELASQICGTPTSLISLLDAHKQWITASVGTDLTETPREVAFCAHAIKTPNIFVVEDATQDPLFENNPLVTGDTNIRFYAGIPLNPPDGRPFGTLCVIDTKARTMSERERAALAILGRQVQTRLELRAKQKKLEAALCENERLATTLSESNELFMTFMHNAPLVGYIKDEEGRMVFYNREMANRFGVSVDDWIGRTDHELWPEEMALKLRETDRRVLSEGVPVEIVETTTDNKGGTLHWKSYKFPFRNRRGGMMVAGMSLDVTADVLRERKLSEANRQLEVLAATDALTNLPNRRVFETRAGEVFAEAVERGRPLSFVILDIDDFKKRNDRYGHAAGDEALRIIGKMLREVTPEGRLSARIGGEEFGVLLPGMASSEAAHFSRRVRRALHDLECGPMRLTASIGIATLDATAFSWQRLLARADDAMYEAKRTGKDKVLSHDELIGRLMAESGGSLLTESAA